VCSAGNEGSKRCRRAAIGTPAFRASWELSTLDADTGWQGKAHRYGSGSRVAWTTAAGINGGTIFRRVSRLDKIWSDEITPKAIWQVVKAAAKTCRRQEFCSPRLRRTCARLCHLEGGELEQIRFLLGHASVQTTERYLCKQRPDQAVNDRLGLEET
jgi:integrase